MTVQTHELRPAAPRPRSRLALAATAAVVALTLGIGGVLGAFLINGRGAGLGSLASFAPADVAMYAEVDLALPGAQRASLAAFLDHWSAVDPSYTRMGINVRVFGKAIFQPIRQRKSYPGGGEA